MAKVNDILIDNEYNLIIRNGDFAIGESDTQHVQIIIDCNKGNILEFSDLGVGAVNYLNANVSYPEVIRTVKLELQKDGYSNININYSKTDDNIYITADRIRR